MLGYTLYPADKLQHTKLVEGADSIFEMVVHRELLNMSREFVPFVMDVVATHGTMKPKERQPIFYQTLYDFSTSGEQWEYKK